VEVKSALDILFFVIGGLGLFIYGMRVMSDALRRCAGDRMRSVVRALTRNIVVAALVGAGMTCLIQSSSATTVMVVGFVNAGLMSLPQAIAVALGANVGTTITAWMVSGIGVLKITNYALPAIGIGLVASMAGKRHWKDWGMVLLGFGLLFFGLDLMKTALEPLGSSPGATELMCRLAGNPLTGVLVGTLMTVVIQSSSATIAVTQLLAFQGILPFQSALYLVLGDNIGTTVTAQIASVGTNIQAKRAARAHLMCKILDALILLPFVWSGVYARFIEFIVPGELSSDTAMVHLAAAHTVFNVVGLFVFLPLVGRLTRLVTRLVPGEATVVPVEPQYLEEHLLDTPPIALEQARREVVRMIELAASATRDAGNAFFTNDLSELQLVHRKEDAVDNLQNQITRYLIQVSRRDLGQTASNELPVLLHSVNDIERIGDHAENLAELAQRKIESRLPFTDAALEELDMMRSAVAHMFEIVISALENSDGEEARSAFEVEERLNAMEREFRENHLQRLHSGDCSFISGMTFVDCVYNYEKIGDHLINTAQAVLGDFQWGEKVRAADARATPSSGGGEEPTQAPGSS